MTKTPPLALGVAAGLFLLPLAAHAVTDTWDGNAPLGGGGDSNFTTGLNWADDTAPANNLATTDLIFGGGVKPQPVVNVAYSVNSITFNNTAVAFNLVGAALTVGTGGITNKDTQTMVFSNQINFGAVANSTVDTESGGLTFAIPTVLPTTNLTVTGAFTTFFNSIIGTSSLTKQGAGTLTLVLSATNGFDLTINGGTVTTSADATTDVFTSSSVIAVNGTSIFNINESLTVDAAQLTRATGGDINLAAGKTLNVKNGGDAVITGAFTNSTASTITVDGAGSTFSTTGSLGVQGGTGVSVLAGGSISTNGAALNIGSASAGTVTVSGTGSNLSAGTLDVGLSGGTGGLTFSNSSTGSFGEIGVDDSASNGTNGSLNVQSGATVMGTSLALADTAVANTGTITITDANSALTISGAGTAVIGAASANTATLNINTSGAFHSGTGLTTVHPTGTIGINGGAYNSHGNLTLNGGQLTRSLAGVLALDAGTTLTVQAGGDVTITDDFDNPAACTVAVTGAGSTFSTSASWRVESGGITTVTAGGDVSASFLLIGSSGNGTVTVDGSGSGASVSTATQLGGAGGAGSLTFTNGSTGALGTIGLINGGNFPNTSGTIQIQSGATVTGNRLTIGNFSVVQTGSVTIDGAGSALTLSGAQACSIGTASATSASLNIQNSGSFSSNTGLTTVNATGTIAIIGGVYTSNGNLTLNGGQLTRDAAGTFNLATSKTITVQNGGDVIFTGNYSFPASTIISLAGAGSTFSTSATLNTGGGTSIGVLGGGSLSAGIANIGNLAGGATATIDGAGTTFTATTLTVGQNGHTGILTFDNGSTGTFGNINVDLSGFAGTVGTLTIQGGSTVTGSVLSVANGVLANTGNVLITEAGSSLALTGNVSTIGAASNTSGTVTVANGATLQTGNGPTNVNATGTLNINAGGTLTGHSDFSGTGQVNIAGTFLPGTASGANQTASVSFAQNMTLQPTTSITMELAGTTPGTQHDRLVFNGPGSPHITWNGTLNVILINGFAPAAGQAFDLFDFDAARDAGAFSAINLPALPAGLFWRTDQLYNFGFIFASVTPSTYAEWQAAFMAGAFHADDDNDGVQNGIEFLLGTDPRVAGGAPLIELAPVDSPPNRIAGVTFAIPTEPASDARYRVYGGSNLSGYTLLASKDGIGPWNTFGTAMVSEGGVVGGRMSIVVSETVPAGTARRFHRLEAGLP